MLTFVHDWNRHDDPCKTLDVSGTSRAPCGLELVRGVGFVAADETLGLLSSAPTSFLFVVPHFVLLLHSQHFQSHHPPYMCLTCSPGHVSDFGIHVHVLLISHVHDLRQKCLWCTDCLWGMENFLSLLVKVVYLVGSLVDEQGFLDHFVAVYCVGNNI